MSGLGKRTSTTIYARVVGGKIAVKAEEGDKDAVMRTNQEGKVVWEVLYDQVEGVLLSVQHQKAKNPKYKDTTAFFFYTGQGNPPVCLTVSRHSRHAKNIWARLSGVEIKRAITVSPYSFVPKDSKTPDKPIRGITVYQDGRKIDEQFAKDHIPKAEQRRDGTWDFYDQDRWYDDLSERLIKTLELEPKQGHEVDPEVEKALQGDAQPPQRQGPPSSWSPTPGGPPGGLDDDEIPF